MSGCFNLALLPRYVALFSHILSQPRQPVDSILMVMALSYVIKSGSAPASGAGRSVFVTGAAGNIGSFFARQCASRYSLSLMVHRRDEDARVLESFGRVIEGSLSDISGLKQHLAGVDTVVHLAGEPDPSAIWSDLLEANIIGTYNLMVAAQAAGCRRVVYASSIHAVSGYPPDVQVHTSDPVNPGDLYGVSKCFGEALGRYFAGHEGLSVIVLRIGAFQSLSSARDPSHLGMLDSFISQRDLCDLITRCIDDEDLQFAIFHGVSDNRFKRLDISDARELVGYAPQDDFTKENPQVRDLDLSARVQACNVEDDAQRSGLRADL